MKGKVLAAIGISGVMMAGGVLSASASSSGYDLLKTSLKKTSQVSSFTAHVQASIEDNGKVIYQADSFNKENLKSHAGESKTKVDNGGKASEVDVYSQNHQTVFKTSSDAAYYVRQGNERFKPQHDKRPDDKFSGTKQKDIENIFDALTKNIQDGITSKELSNGNKEIQLDLAKNEIPAVGQAVASFMIKNVDEHSNHMEKGEFGKFTELKPHLPQLVNNITVTRAVLTGEVNKDQYLVSQEATIYVTGDDAQGTPHDLVLHIKNTMNNINHTTVQPINLKGKKVVNVQQKFGHRDE